MYAVIETGGKQYQVNEGDVIFIEKLAANTAQTLCGIAIVILCRIAISTKFNRMNCA